MSISRPVIISLADDLEAACQAFINVSRAKGLSPRTIVYYEERLMMFKRYVDEHAPGITPRDVSAGLVREFLLTARESGSSPATVNHNRAVLYRMFRLLMDDGALDFNPVEKVGKLREATPVIQTFSTEQVKALLDSCDTKTFVGVRDKALFTLLYDSGLRISEAISLKLDDVQWTEQLLRVMGKGGKGRLVPFGLAVRKSLTTYLTRRGEIEGQNLLFVNLYGEVMDKDAIRWTMIRRGKKAGITGVRLSPHTFRHTFAVTFLRNGGDVFSLQRMLGHSGLAMTRRYVELCQEDIQAAHRRFSPADRMGIENKTGRKRLR